jgi:prepilin-type N-terminal cleavage/methylation domain-containing protein
MRECERGFTLVELIVAVGITVVLLAAGGVWLLGMHPGALRNAADEFDAELAAARAIAASSGNGATIGVVPRVDGQGTTMPGFVLRVYSGRPTAPNAVQPTNVAALSSPTTVREATFGSPSFALFFDSAGEVTGARSYPAIDAHGGVSFPVIAQQPPCPANGIRLTFTSAQGATATRTLPCAAWVAGGSGSAAPSPTPNPPHIVPDVMVAHWTGDVYGALNFYVAEFGYMHWYADPKDNGCDAMTTFATPNPYSPPQSSQEAALPPMPPATPFSWANTMYGGNANDPQSHFQLRPIAGIPGMCTLSIADDYGQEATASVQVMGDLHATTSTTLTWQLPDTSAKTITLAKVWDSDPLLLQESGPCAGLVNVTESSHNAPPSPGPSPASTGTLTITPTGITGSCTLQVTDQYHETPFVPVTVQVNAEPFDTWPEEIQLGVGGSKISMRSAPNVARLINLVLGGGVASALTSGCYAAALTSSGSPDPLPSAVANWAHLYTGIYIDPNGCFVNSGGAPVSGTAAVIVYEPNGNAKTFSTGPSTTCFGTYASIGSWVPSPPRNTVDAGLRISAGTSAGSCIVAITDGTTVTPVLDHGLSSVNIVAAETITLELTTPHGCSVRTGQVETCLWYGKASYSPTCYWTISGQGTFALNSQDTATFGLITTASAWQNQLQSAITDYMNNNAGGAGAASGSTGGNTSGCPT